MRNHVVLGMRIAWITKGDAGPKITANDTEETVSTHLENDR